MKYREIDFLKKNTTGLIFTNYLCSEWFEIFSFITTPKNLTDELNGKLVNEKL